MSISGIFSGRWLVFSGGVTYDSCRLRFCGNPNGGSQMDLQYRFDADETILLTFALTTEEVAFVTSTLENDSYAILESNKNGYPFVLEIRLRDGNAAIRLEGHGVTGLGQPQGFLMPAFETVY